MNGLQTQSLQSNYRKHDLSILVDWYSYSCNFLLFAAAIVRSHAVWMKIDLNSSQDYQKQQASQKQR
jgi:hypothetical protein